MKLFKLIFVGVEQEYTHIVVGVGPDREEAQKRVPKRPVTSIYQIYEKALDGKDAIHRVECKAIERGIEIKEFTKVSLIVSMDVVGEFMKEGL